MNNIEYISKINNMLEKYIDDIHIKSVVCDSMRYSLLSGGKRIRPLILIEFYNICGGTGNVAFPFACALEMIHTYSLIHDDLPCMDNSDLRRGKLSNHKTFGETTALLAGDALLTKAFEVASCDDVLENLDPGRALKAIWILSRESGISGMIHGQELDIANEGKKVSFSDLQIMDEKKTGALIMAAAEMGCILAGADGVRINAARKYARAIGLAFQIVDDIIDVISDSKVLGKPSGSDVNNNKSTYVSLYGLENAKSLVKDLTCSAIEELSVFDGNTTPLCNLANDLSNRLF